MGKLIEEGMKAGWLLGTEGCLPSALGARVRRSGNDITVTDGPFTEAKEFVGGFFLLDCETRQQALSHAAECPAAEWATIEVREVGPCYE